MKKILLLSTVCLLTSNAYSMDVRPYIEGKISQNWLEAEYKETGFESQTFKNQVLGSSLEVGTKLDNFRIGLEAYYNDKMEDKFFDIVPVEGETKGVFLNGYFDIPLPNLKQVKPYIGVGLGYSWLKGTVDLSDWGYGKDSLKDIDLSWNIGVGVGFAVNDNFDLTLGYRYENLGKIKDEDIKTDFTNYKLSFGIRYTF